MFTLYAVALLGLMAYRLTVAHREAIRADVRRNLEGGRR